MADLEVIAEGTVTAASLEITLIDQSYQHLSLETNFMDTGTGARAFVFQVYVNGLTSWDYGYQRIILQNGQAMAATGTGLSGYVSSQCGYIVGNYSGAQPNQRSAVQMYFPGYSNTDFNKTWFVSCTSQDYTAGDQDSWSVGTGGVNTDAAIESIKLAGNSGSNITGNYCLYGWKSA